MQKIELWLVALGSIVISLSLSVLYQNNFDTKQIIQKKSVLASDTTLEDLHARLSNIEQGNLKTDSKLDIIALNQTLSSIQDQLTALQEKEESSTENSSDDNKNDYLTDQQKEELEIRQKEHWDSQVYDSLQNVQYADEINELFTNNSESGLITTDCGSKACRVEMTLDNTMTEPDFTDKINQLDWVQWGNIAISEGQMIMYLSADAEQMIEPVIE